MKKYVFDSSALISYLDAEPNATKIADLLDEINSDQSESLLCIINLGEIYYHFLRTGGSKTAETALNALEALPIKFIDVNLDLTLEAANIKAFNKISYADCFCAALTKINRSTLITSDKEFLQLKNQIKIHWI